MKKSPGNMVHSSHKAGRGIEISRTNFTLCDQAIRTISDGELYLSTVGDHYIVMGASDETSKHTQRIKQTLEASMTLPSSLPELERLTIAINQITKKLDEESPSRIPGIPSRGAMQWLAQRYQQSPTREL